jgi:hypothetical protein
MCSVERCLRIANAFQSNTRNPPCVVALTILRLGVFVKSVSGPDKYVLSSRYSQCLVSKYLTFAAGPSLAAYLTAPCEYPPDRSTFPYLSPQVCTGLYKLAAL